MIDFQSKIISLSVFVLISTSAMVSVEAQTLNSDDSVESADINATATDESITTDLNSDNETLDRGGRGGRGRGDWDRGGRGGHDRGGRGDWDRGRGDHGRGGYYPPGRGGHDRGRGGYNPPGRGGHYPPPSRGYYPPPRRGGGNYPPPNRGYYPPPNRGSYPPGNGYYGACNDQSVSLYCKINGVHQYITAYTSCGYSSEGSSCYNVSTPGYYQVAMRIAYRCQSGQWVWLLGNDGQCKLSY